MKRVYYALFTCNVWKEHDSMRLVGIFTEKRIKPQVKMMLKGELNIEFYEARNFSDKQEYREFWKEFETMNFNQITTAIPIIDIMEIKINETV
jgi:hypothetical protein